MSSFVSNTRYIEPNNLSDLKSTESIQEFSEEQSADYSKNPIECSIETSIKAAALIMTNKRVGSINHVGRKNFQNKISV